MTSHVAMEFRVLGPLEARIDGEPIPLGGAKQRAVLAVLLLNANKVISVDRLVDEVWGDHAPPSASHSLEAYVSRIRQLLNGHGPTLTRRGAGYRLDLGGAVLDSDVFALRLEDASQAAAEGHLESASELAVAALALWYGPALADVSLASAGRAEAERLEELRLRTCELRFDAELALGRNERAIGELQALVAQNPYRERFVAQLMLALYRCGRHADALEVYERIRAALSEDLGLQPSAELQQLSGQIVRQDPQLRRPAAPLRPARSHPLGGRTRRVSELVLVGSLVAAIMALTASGSARQPTAGKPTPEATEASVTLVLPENNPDVALDTELSRQVRYAASTWDLGVQILRADETDMRELTNVRRRVERGRPGLVLILGDGPLATRLSSLPRRMTDSTFVFLDASLADLSLAGVANAGAVRFADEQTSQLMGYLSALVPKRHGTPKARVDAVSVVAGPPSPHRARVISGFTHGVKSARPGVSVLVAHADELVDPTACERIANDHINKGADVVFVEAGKCGLGALAVARLRGVWGVGGYDDGVTPSPHVLAITYKDWARAVYGAVEGFMLESMRLGQDRMLGLEDDYAVGVDIGNLSPVVSESLWSKVVLRCSELRRRALASSS